MPRNARTVAPGIPYHITQRGTNRQRVFFSAADRLLYLRLIRERLDAAGVGVLAYCLMSNHVHLVVAPEREDSLASLFGYVNGRYAQALNIRKGRSGHLWQARYFSCALSDRHLSTALQYVERNPCRAGLVDHAEQYRWSSAAVHLLGVEDRSGILDLDFWSRSGGAPTWMEMHGSQLLDEQTIALRKCTYSGRPFGDESFVESMEQRFGRKWRRGKHNASQKNAILA
jgi:putative transposase